MPRDSHILIEGKVQNWPTKERDKWRGELAVAP